MTQKVNGAAYSGIWVEKQVTFIKLTFSADITALPAADLFRLGTTTPVSADTVADSSFDVVESALVQALKALQTKATVLGVSKFDVDSLSVDVMLGYAEGWFSNNVGVIATDLPITAAQAKITTAGTSALDAIGVLVSVDPTSVTFDMSFAAFNGGMTVATAAAGDLAIGPGSTSGATPTNSPTGTPGYYPVLLASV